MITRPCPGSRSLVRMYEHEGSLKLPLGTLCTQRLIVQTAGHSRSVPSQGDVALMPSDEIAVFASVISMFSALTVWLTYKRGIVAERRSRMPALVFRYNEANQLFVANVGKGPAMNIVYAQGRRHNAQEGEPPIALKRGRREPWFNPIHLRPIEPGGSVIITWQVKGAGWGLKYTDAFGMHYVVKTGPHGMRVLEGRRHLPSWDLNRMCYPEDIARLNPKPTDPWGECAPWRRPKSNRPQGVPTRWHADPDQGKHAFEAT